MGMPRRRDFIYTNYISLSAQGRLFHLTFICCKDVQKIKNRQNERRLLRRLWALTDLN